MAEIDGDDSRSAAETAVMEPTTEAGRELLEIIYGMDPQGLYPPDPFDLIRAIEDEAADEPARETDAAMNFGQGLAEGRREALRQAREAAAALPCLYSGLPVSECKASACEGDCDVQSSLALAAIDALGE